MINRVILVGRLTKDPALRKTQSGTSVVSFSLAVNRRVQNGEQQADFINCVAWNKTADLMAQYLKKGALIGVEGRIQSRSYDDQSGKRVYVQEVICESVQFLESKGSAERNTYGNSYSAPQSGYQTNAYVPSQNFGNEPVENDYQPADTLDIASDDLPF